MVMAWMVILWIYGESGTVLQTKHGGLHGTWWGSSTLGLVEEIIPAIKMMRFQEWEPGDIDTGEEMQKYEGPHRGHAVKKFTWMEFVDNGQQCLERAMMEGQREIYTVSEMCLHKDMYRVSMARRSSGVRDHSDFVGVDHWTGNQRGSAVSQEGHA